MSSPAPLDPRHQEASALLATAREAAAQGNPQGLAVALQHSERIIPLLHPLATLANPAAMIDLASTWMLRGQACEAHGVEEALAEAVRSYDCAIALLQALPPGANNIPLRRDLAGAWMNRGNALQKQSRPEALAEAITAYDRAIASFADLPFADQPAYRNSLGAAWMNRGLALHRQGTEASLNEAVRSHGHAISLLQDLPLEAHPMFRLNLAAAWMNQANALLGHGQPHLHPSARTAAKEAIRIVAAQEQESPHATDLGLKARRALCDALGSLLVTRLVEEVSVEELGAEASDTADEGLALVRLWESRGLPHFRPLAVRLYRFGSQLYRIQQPHFLAEFLLEMLDPEIATGALPGVVELHEIADESLAATIASLRSRPLYHDAPETARRLRTVEDLQAAQIRIAELRRQYGQTASPQS